jgi:hypothetical protein
MDVEHHPAEARQRRPGRQARPPGKPTGSAEGSICAKLANTAYPDRVAGRKEDRSMSRLTACLVALLLACGGTFAAEFQGVTMPDTLTIEGRQLLLNGMGLREKLWIDVYVAGLYLEEQSDRPETILDSDQVKHLRMHFVYKKVATKKLTDAWSEGLEANQPGRTAEFESSLARLNGWMEEMKAGDEMAFTSIPGSGIRVEVKGQQKGVIEDDAFAKAFWSIFLGEKPPTEKLKKGLLGQS